MKQADNKQTSKCKVRFRTLFGTFRKVLKTDHDFVMK